VKFNNLKAFKKHLKDASPSHFATVYLVVGKEAFHSTSACRALATALLPDWTLHSSALRWFDADKHSIDDLLFELNTLSFLDERKVLGFLHIDKLSKEVLKSIESQMDRLPHNYFLILVASTLSSSSAFYKKAEKLGVVFEFIEMKPWERERYLVDWVGEELFQKGKSAPPNICQALVKRGGTDQSTLLQEIDKLLCYIGERREITLKDIQTIITPLHQESIWELGEAILSGETPTALKIARALLNDEAHLFSLLRQIRFQFQTGYQLLGLFEQSGVAGVMQEFTYMKGQILDRNLRLAQQYGRARFQKGILAIDSAELDAKNAKGAPEFILDILIIKLTR
jgi:DNA polymerase III subunit delta